MATPKTPADVRNYLDQGFNVIPINPEKGTPYVQWKKYQNEPTKPELVESWAVEFPDCRWAIVCGHGSGGLYVLDFDDPYIYDEFFAKVGQQTTVVRTPSGGVHLWFRSHKELRKDQSYNGLALDIQGEKSYVMAPPSVREDGAWTFERQGHILEVDDPKILLDRLPKPHTNDGSNVKQFKKEMIKAGWDISHVIQHYGVEKKSSGHNYWQGLCPIHTGDTKPSFTVYDDHYYCFGCGRDGDTIDFVREMEECEFMEAVKKLETITGVKSAIKGKAPEAAPMPDMNSTDRLIELGKQDAVFFHTPDDTCYAAVRLETGGSAIIQVAAKGVFAKILRQRYYTAIGKAPQPDVLKNAIDTLEAAAWGNGDIKTLHNRVAWHDDSIVYDLTTPNYEAIEITSRGWGLMPRGHILFRRYSHQIPQVMPITGGDPWRLFEFVNMPESNRLLAMVYLISCFVPDIAHVLPIITGEHGAAKTCASDTFKLLVDPSDIMGGISLPGSEDRLHQMLSHHWFIIFDNIDWIRRGQSDALCRASTGQATAVRALYTNEDDVVFKYKMCVGLNGINNAATKADLLDRAIFLNLDTIPDDRRIHEKVLWRSFSEAKPEILGGIFDALSKALSIYPNTHLDNLPRMADFAVWGCAIAEALGRSKEEFLNAYYENIGRVNRAALEASPVAVAIMALMEDRAEWEGSPSCLLRELDLLAVGLYIDTKSKSWAKSPESLGRRMTTILPNLRKAGIGVERGHSGERNYRLYYLNLRNKLSNLSNLSTANEKLKKANCPTCPTCPADRERQLSNRPESGQLDTDKNQQQADHLDRLDRLDSSVTTHNRDGICGKCGCELSGQTFQGAAGLGKICADCQAEVDRTSGLAEQIDTDRDALITDAIFRLGRDSENHEFNVVKVLLELPRKQGFTTEMIERFMVGHSDDLKIERMGGGKWKVVK